ncbi:catecholate siderophore receptor Fiu [Pseudoduganella sp. FT25W]|uniref:Catecholate siderophore receptor Fiu n=1 Tax=Duganella alba TaxID=2666081 RepID=A0A6L5QBR3_9BURK|nr:catecholate siderophore receptor Fiu [Duganella alba]MRX07040.1 catecholate siderophore receptor Fiu [Duganella alba]MRX16063.1 catecholate siderophore receptor Fiu [Duganella alba]
MAMIKSRKHAQTRFNQHMSAALAAMLLPVAAQAADAVPTEADAQAKPQTMQEVQVNGSRENDFKAERAASAKYTEKLVDTAQTLTVIKKELIEQQGATTLTEALRNTPGVGAFFLGENGSTNTGDAIYMRGFDASGSIYVDGVRDVGSVARDTFNIEQIDVLKGPAGTDNGRSSPTGSINLVTKQPQLENAYQASVTGGSGKQKRGTADINTVIDADSGTAFRLNVLDQDSGNPARDVVKNKRWAIAPSLAYGLNSPTRVYLDLLHVKQNNIPDGGVLTIGLPGYTSPDTTRPFLTNARPVDPKNFYGSTLDHDDVKADMVTLKIEHDFAGGAKLVNTSRYGKTTENYLLTSFMATAANLVTPNVNDPSTWTMKRTNLTFKDQVNEIVANQTTLTADITSGAVKHTLVGGIEFTNEKQTNYTWAATGGTALPPTSIYNPNPNAAVNVTYARNGATGNGSTNTESIYLFDTAKIGDKWIINGGVRVDHYNTTYNAVTVQAAVTAPAPQVIPVGTLLGSSIESGDTLVNGKLSVAYKPTADSSVYGLVASSKSPPGGTTFTLSSAANSAANPNYDPQTTTNYEVGTKWDLLQQKLSFTAAAFRTEVKNEIEVDPTNPAVYYQNGKKRVQGIELGVTGEILPKWLVSAGYTHQSTSVESGKVVTANGENQLSYTPKQAFTLWTSYTLPFGLQLGGGARFSDKLLRGTDGAIGTPAYADSYWVFDAMAAYPINKNIDLRLNVYNLGDKDYVQAINKSGYRYTPGAPRSASLTANFKF